VKQNFTEDLPATTHCPLFSSIGQTASTEAKKNTTSTTDHFMTNEQAKHIILLCNENNKMLKALMQYHGIVIGSEDSATLARKKLKYDCDNMHITKAVEISPVSIRRKQKRYCM
jgi:predicted transglutaminase-like cysteine proteinase